MNIGITHNNILYPIVVILVAVGSLILTIISFIRERESKIKLINLVLATIFMLSNIIGCAIYFAINNNASHLVFFTFTIITTIFSSTLFIYTGLLTYRSLKENSLFIKSVKASPWNSYIMINKKDKIIKISKSLLDQLGFSKDKVILHRDFFETIFQRIRIKTINGISFDNKSLISKFSDLKKTIKPTDKLTFELCFYNEVGDEVYLKFLMQGVFYFNSYAGMVINGELKTNFKMLDVEKQLQTVASENDLLVDKFVSLLEISGEMIAFYNLGEKTVWLNDRLRSEFSLNDNTINMQNIRQLIEPTDLANYDKHLASLTPDHPTYAVKFRINCHGGLYWYEETGKKIFTKDNVVIVATIKKVNTHHFWKTGFEKLDSLEGETEMVVKMKQLIKEHYFFNCIYLKVNNLPKVNEEFGRQTGNLLLAQYIEKLSISFISDKSQIYRITGSTFAIIVTDPRKMDSFKTGARQKSDYLNLVLKMGSLEMFADVYAGISVFKKDSVFPEELMKMANQALNFALNPNYDGQICFFSSNDSL